MNKKTPKKNDTATVLQVPSILIDKIITLVKTTRSKVAVYLNAETTIMYWFVGHYIETEIKQKEQINYGKQILATLSQQLTQALGKGFSYAALTRMVKVAETFNHQNIATLSQQLSWSHDKELMISGLQINCTEPLKLQKTTNNKP